MPQESYQAAEGQAVRNLRVTTMMPTNNAAAPIRSHSPSPVCESSSREPPLPAAPLLASTRGVEVGRGVRVGVAVRRGAVVAVDSAS